MAAAGCSNHRRSGVNLARRRLRTAAIRARGAIGHQPEKTILVTGAGRSGTTWIAEITAAMVGGALFFEPDHPKRGVSSQLVGPERSLASRKILYEQLVKGKGANNFAVRDLRSFLTSRRLVLKSITATDVLPELVAAEIVRRPVVVIRHPCAVVASRLRANFSPPGVDWLLTPRLLESFPHLEALRGIDTPCERHALGWALTYLPIAAAEHPDVFISRYEDFVTEPEQETARLAEHLGLNEVLSQRRTTTDASFTDFTGDLRAGTSQVTKWQERLDECTIAEILNVTRTAGIRLYDELPRPSRARLIVEL